AGALAALTFAGLGSMAFAEEEVPADTTVADSTPAAADVQATVPTSLPAEPAGSVPSVPTSLPAEPEGSVPSVPTSLPPVPTSLPPVPTSVSIPPVVKDGTIVVDSVLGTISASCTSTGNVAIELSNPKMGLEPVKLTLDAGATLGQVSQLAKTFNITNGAIEAALSKVTDCDVTLPDVLQDPSQPPASPGGISGAPMADIGVNCLSDGTVDVKLINPTLVPRVFSVLVGDVQVANPTIEPGTSPTIKIDMAEDATAVITVQVGVLEFVNTVSLDCLVNNSLPLSLLSVNNSLPLSLLSLFNKAGAASPPAVLGTSVAPAAVAAAAAGTLPRTGGDSGLFIAAGLALATLGLFAGRAARQAKAVEAGILS
ncbi:MAG: hypothetical protein HYR89_08735, partial [Actinobacteria bacterium]|nr:hypothetical protein [Actinomycetota bacterium]